MHAVKWIDAALLAAFAENQTTIYRVATSEKTWVERYDRDFLISCQHEEDLDPCRGELLAWCGRQGLPARRIFGRHLPLQSDQRKAPVLLQGDASFDPVSEISEAAVRYAVDFSAGYSTGFFMDQRVNRAHLKKLAPKKVLNCFAYTCSFSVVAALAGAATVSVDLSGKSLDRGKDNFRLNGLDPAAHQFIADDVFKALPYLHRKQRLFDAVILDPPTFSRGRGGKAFQANRDFQDLVEQALVLCEPKAHVLLSTNSAKLSVDDLRQAGRFGARIIQQSADFFAAPLPPDLDRSFAAKSVWMTLK